MRDRRLFSTLCARREATLNDTYRWPRIAALALACTVGVGLTVAMISQSFHLDPWLQGRDDFLGFYAGARLVGGPHLYDPAAVRAVQTQAVGEAHEIKYGRIPFFALVLKPLAWLPYHTAHAVWALLLAAAFAAFIALWPGVAASTRWLICCWSLPAFVSLFNSQDDVVLLLWIALAARLLRADKPVAAGLVLALCASKFHLVGLVPLVILVQRRWRMAGGLALGVVVLLALSFAVAGWGWPARYYAVLANPEMSTGADHMPNLHSLFWGLGAAGMPLQIAAALLLVAGLFLAARATSDFEAPLALALVTGVLVGFHGYLADGALFLPALFIFSTAGYARVPALVLPVPIPWLLLQCPRPWPVVAQALMVALAAAGFAWIMKRQPGQREPAGIGAANPQVQS